MYINVQYMYYKCIHDVSIHILIQKQYTILMYTHVYKSIVIMDY